MNMIARKQVLASAFALVITSIAGDIAASETTAEINEARQESQILTTYALSPNLDDHTIKVSVHDGVATLTGKVREDVNKELAQQIALGVKGIKDVDNQINIDADYNPPKLSGERRYSEIVKDASITATVKSKLLWSKHAQGLSVNVDTRSAKVTLNGTANNSEAKEMAGLLASNTAGVKTVDNNLTVEEAGDTIMESAKNESKDMGQQISDTWITTKVKSMLMYSSNVSGSDISVTTKEGVVSLSGKVASSAEHALAIELTKNVRGVSSVNAKALKRS